MIVAGFGFRASASVDSLRSAYEIAAKGHVVSALATAEDKAQAACLQALAGVLALPVIPVPAALIKSAQTLSHSPRAQRLRGTGSVAEAAATVGAGTGARLVSPRHISQDRKATCAIAVGVEP